MKSDSFGNSRISLSQPNSVAVLPDPEKPDLKGFQAAALLAGNCLSLGSYLGFILDPVIHLVNYDAILGMHQALLDYFIAISVSNGEVQNGLSDYGRKDYLKQWTHA